MHLAWTHLQHAVHNTESDVTRVPHTPQGCILLSNVSSSIPFTIIFVFPKLTLIPLLSNASFHSSKVSLNSSIVSPLGPNRLHKEFPSFSLSLHFPLLQSITIANNKGHNTDPWCTPTFTENSSDRPEITPTAPS